jgi:hypothetical protein
MHDQVQNVKEIKLWRNMCRQRYRRYGGGMDYDKNKEGFPYMSEF